MLSAIKKSRNECFIGAFQFFYYKKFNKYIPDKIIKEFFHFNSNGVSLKAVKMGLNRLGWNGKIYHAKKEEIPNNKWCILMVKEKYGLHYVVVKKNKNITLCFDPAIGILKNYNLDDEIILIDIEANKPFVWRNDFEFKCSKKELILLISLNILEVLFIFTLSFYFKYALFAVENKDKFMLKETVILFSFFAISSLSINYIKNLFINKKLWEKIKNIYEYFFNYLLRQNAKLKNYFTKMNVFSALEQGVSYIHFNLISKTNFVNAIMLTISSIVILIIEYKLLFIPIISLFLLSSMLTVFFRDKTFKINEKIRSNEIAVTDNFLQLFDNIETSSGFEKESYQYLISKNLNENIKLNYKKGKFNSWVTINFGFISFVFNMVVSAKIFLWMINDSVTISNGIYLVTIATMLYTNLVKIWSFIFNYNLEYDSYNKFIDFVIEFDEYNDFMSYDGKDQYTNKLEGIKGHFQLRGKNGSGKSTYLKLFCGLFSKAHSKRIYISQKTNVIKNPNMKIYKKINIEEYYLKRKNVSDGQRQIRNVLLALETDFEALVLDEAMSSVAIKIRNMIYQYILKKYKNKTILIVDHDIKIKINQLNIVL